MSLGGAFRARARTSPDDVRIRQAAPRIPGTSAPPGLLRPRSGQTAGDGFRGPPRTLMHLVRHTMSATGPFRILPSFRMAWARPGGWLCTALKKHRPPAEPRWHPPPQGLRRTLRQTPRGIPPAWTDTFSVHPAAEAREVWHGSGGWGKDWGDFRLKWLRNRATLVILGLRTEDPFRDLSTSASFGRDDGMDPRRQRHRLACLGRCPGMTKPDEDDGYGASASRPGAGWSEEMLPES